MKKISISLTMLLLMIFLSGCNESIYSTQTSNDSGVEDGFYVNSEGINYSLISLENEINLEEDSDQIYPVLVNEEELENVPVLTDTNVLIEISSNEPSEQIYIYKLEELGSSIGLVLEKSSNPGEYAIKRGTVLTNSSAGAAFEDLSRVRITAISGERIGENILTEVKTIKGLKRDMTYPVTSVEGSTVKRNYIKADTRVFTTKQSSGVMVVDKGIYTDNGYIQVVLPVLEDGYYYLKSPNKRGGIFKIEKEKR